MSPWSVEPLCTPRCAVDGGPRVPHRVAVRRLASLVTTLARAVAAGERVAEPEAVRILARTVLADLGVGLETAPGAERLLLPGPVGTLVAANHVSWLDAVALLAVEPGLTVLAKREVGAWPVVGTLARRTGARFIDREGLRHLPRTVADLADLLRSGRSVMVFPQATTWCTAAGGTFRPATFQAALDAAAPVRPVTLDYRRHGTPTTVAAFLGDENFATGLRRVLTTHNLTIHLTPHPPPPGTDRRGLAAAARRIVAGEEAPVHAA